MCAVESFRVNDDGFLPLFPLPLGQGGVKACRVAIDDVRRRVRAR